jgi:dihydropteroate synthase
VTSRLDAWRRVLGERRSFSPLLMGICNVTPDSFSDGGKYLTPEAARSRVDELLAEGADIVDVGGESTRPGSSPVSADEQLRRVLPVVSYAAKKALVSIDTTSAEVARECLQAGASIVNDVSCLGDEALARVAAEYRAPFVLMHSRGPQAAMRGYSEYPDDAYPDLVTDVLREWGVAAARAEALGVERGALLMDPGLGFAKNARQSAELLRRTSELVAAAGVPVLVGASRKSFLKIADASAAPGERLGASLAAALHAAREGASVLRVHDVRATRQALALDAAMRGGGR